ncbi:MAG: protein kinase [Candidatus Obscuribacter sp.]|nr:protein kinase [Candidatus Obscuribacter sp.]
MAPGPDNQINLDERRRKTVTRVWGTAGTKPVGAKVQDLKEGTVIGGAFRVIAPIGRGGMGVVYQAVHLALKRECALKVLSPELVNQVNWKRFQKEAKAIASLSHPCLVQVYDLGIHNSRLPYYAMDLLKGKDLESVIHSKGSLSLPEAINIMLKALDGFAYAHRNGVIHRDIKPANILLTREANGETGVKILDFGIAKLAGFDDDEPDQSMTATGEIFGSPFYMSPEQCMGEPVDARSDIYSLGCTLFEMLTGQVPFEAATSLEIVMMHLEEYPPTLSQKSGRNFPKSIEAVMGKCLAKNPEFRYQNAKELAIDLERISQGKEILPDTSQNAARSQKAIDMAKKAEQQEAEAGKSAAPWIMVSLVLLTMTLTVGLSISLLKEPNKPKPEKSLDSTFQRDTTSLKTTEEAASSVSLMDPMVSQPVITDWNKPYRVPTKTEEAEILFEFPNQRSIGSLNYATDECAFDNDAKLLQRAREEELTIPLAARGTVSVDRNLPLAFKLLSFADSRQVLSGFSPNDLTQLEMSNSNLSDKEKLAPLLRLTGLKVLSLKHCELTDAGLKELDRLKNLKKLDIADNPCSTKAIAELKLLKSLRDLSFSTDENCERLLIAAKETTRLESLSINGPMKVANIELIGEIPFLKTLNISSAMITSTHLKELGKLENVEKLILTNCVSDNAHLKDYSYLTNMRSLRLVNPVGLHLVGCKFIKRQLPKCNITLEEKPPGDGPSRVLAVED